MNVMRWMVLGVLAGCLTGAAVAAETGKVTGVKAPAAGAANSVEVQSLLSSGRQALGDGKWAEAVALFEKVRKLDPGLPEADFGLSAACIELGRFDEALPLLEALRKTAPDNPMVLNNLAWVYVKTGNSANRNPAKAVKLAREALLEMPADYSIWNTLAEAYYADGKFDLALRAAESALRLNRLAGVTNTASCRELVARCRRATSSGAAADEAAGRP